MRSRCKLPSPALAVLLSALVFCGYFLSAMVGPSVPLTILCAFGLAGLVVLSVLPSDCGPSLTMVTPSWLQRPERFLLATTVWYFVAKRCSLLLHEWSHAVWANCLGVRTGSIFDIHYGHGWIMKGVYAVDGGGFYDHLFGSGHGSTAALVAMGGPLTNAVLAAIAMVLMRYITIQKHPLWAYFLFWNAVHNLAQLWSYTPARTMFHDGGDIALFCKGMHIPPWLFLVVGTVLLGAALYLLLARLLVRLAQELLFPPRRGLGVLALAWATVFLYYGALPILYSVSTFMDPSMLLLALELSVGLVVGVLAYSRMSRFF